MESNRPPGDILNGIVGTYDDQFRAPVEIRGRSLPQPKYERPDTMVSTGQPRADVLAGSNTELAVASAEATPSESSDNPTGIRTGDDNPYWPTTDESRVALAAYHAGKAERRARFGELPRR